jgi:hypothetical protein
VRPAPQRGGLGGKPPDPGSPHQQPNKVMRKICETAREGDAQRCSRSESPQPPLKRGAKKEISAFA